MKNAELIALMIANTNKTKNMRTYGKKWFSGARRITDKIATKIGKVVALVQDNIDRGHIINGNTQALLVYNFQPLYASATCHFVALDMVIKPIDQIDNTHDLSGVPIQLVIDAPTGEVMNNACALLKMELADPEIYDDVQNPISYGNYHDYQAVTSFVPLSHNNHVSADDIVSGHLDFMPLIQTSVAFDSFVEARTYLDNNYTNNYTMVAEMNYSKEQHLKMIAGGFGRHVIKLIHPHQPLVEVSNIVCAPTEKCIEDEVHCLLEAAKEHEAIPDFGVANC